MDEEPSSRVSLATAQQVSAALDCLFWLYVLTKLFQAACYIGKNADELHKPLYFFSFFLVKMENQICRSCGHRGERLQDYETAKQTRTPDESRSPLLKDLAEDYWSITKDIALKIT